MRTTGIEFVLYEPKHFGFEHAVHAAQIAVNSGLRLAHTKLKKTENDQYIRVLWESTPERLVSANSINIESQETHISLNQDITFYAVSDLKYPFTERTRANDIDFVFSFRAYPDSIQIVEGYVGNVGGNQRAPAARLLFTIAKLFFERFKPEYGWLDFSYKLHPTALKKTLKTRRIQELYWTTFFGNGYVDHYGPKFFAEAPVWNTNIMAESGVILQLSSDIAPAREVGSGIDKVIDYFTSVGLKYVSWPKNVWLKKTS
ncbi:MAG: hypothetical protein J5I90_04410 [Caldilineales bacterium]|nr:hypothetical protein [Caldilineales bacterium]